MRRGLGKADCIAIQCPAKPRYDHCSSDTARRRWAGRAGGRRRGQGSRLGAGCAWGAGLGAQAGACKRAAAGGERRWAGARARRQARGRTPASRAHRRQAAGAGGTGVRALGSRGRARQAAGAWQGAAGVRPERWARGLALGYALGVLDLFLARFNSVFS